MGGFAAAVGAGATYRIRLRAGRTHLLDWDGFESSNMRRGVPVSPAVGVPWLLTVEGVVG